MSNIEQTHFPPDWRQLCQAALLETNPVKLLERIAQARNAVLDRIEDGHTKPLNGEQHDLRDALARLDGLRRITERNNEPLPSASVTTNYSWQDSYRAVLLETDWTKMQERVRTAESEIHKRRLELSQDHGGTQEEREALVNAMSGLGVLRMNVASWLEELGGTLVRKPVQHEPHPFRPTFESFARQG